MTSSSIDPKKKQTYVAPEKPSKNPDIAKTYMFEGPNHAKPSGQLQKGPLPSRKAAESVGERARDQKDAGERSGLVSTTYDVGSVLLDHLARRFVSLKTFSESLRC